MIRWLVIVLGVMVATAIAGELKMSPFHGAFRISLGSAVFFFLLLLFKPRYLPIVGVIVGCFVSLFRMTVDVVSGVAQWEEAYLTHIPAAWYYIAFVIVLSLIRYKHFLSAPLLLGLIGGLVDFGSNLVELLARMVIEQRQTSLHDDAPILLLVGVLRSYLVVGVYNMLEIRQLRAVSREQQKRMEKLLLILSELYEERLYLQKLMGEVEQITADSYQLYRQLAGDPRASKALRLAEEVHEVKKDAQRIVAGLSKLIRQENMAERLSLADVAKLVSKANMKYAEHLGKQVDIQVNIQGPWETNRFYSLLSLLNNIVANAVEAFKDEGKIVIDIFAYDDDIWFEISDNGPGIEKRDWELIFQPGYTTKYDQAGNASTGIGLAHVKSTLREISGKIEVGESKMGGAMFRIIVPGSSL
ncbi:sensor histidine kinase [Brevibacillus humidisoli]|uniref:sensor histidine kinase n=1 Tax=Brevibacillus humidisoli TaxID=2895522 RepID=UPI001E2B4726|nr:sensor histidine kinase [Brevibacillus humidisoli]UFJ39028.1 sensor histidine kinase [Brevibacillus humidisoli]